MSENKDLALEALTDFLNAVEAGIEAARQRIKTDKALWDPSKIQWTQANGPSGVYERSEDVDNPEFKAMLKDLRAHNNRMTRGGYFYWAFEKSAVVGRKKAKNGLGAIGGRWLARK
jgi:hypothetical protein